MWREAWCGKAQGTPGRGGQGERLAAQEGGLGHSAENPRIRKELAGRRWGAQGVGVGENCPVSEDTVHRQGLPKAGMSDPQASFVC